MDASELSPIAKQTKDCLGSFNHLLGSLKSSEEAASFPFTYDDCTGQLGRLRIWAGNIGALQDARVATSLEHRLRDAPRLASRIHELLEDLHESVEDLTEIVSGERPNRTGSVSFEDEFEDSDDEPPDLASSVVESASEAEELNKSISDSISSLFKISLLIRNATPRDRYAKATAAPLDPFDDSFDVSHVRQKFPKLDNKKDEWLAVRLGKAITQRRQFLRYCREHHDKLAAEPRSHRAEVQDSHAGAQKQEHLHPNIGMRGDGASSIRTKPTSTLAPTTASTLLPAVVEAIENIPDDLQSEMSDATSVADTSSSSQLHVVELGRVSSGTPTFECPYCWGIVQARRQRSWRKHVLQDLKPYICTFDECDVKMFGDRHAWFSHELEMHRKDYQCHFCSSMVFPTQYAFKEHLRHQHAQQIGEQQIQAVVNVSQRQVERIPAASCPLCDEWEQTLRGLNPHIQKHDVITVTPTQFRQHLGGHLEQLALFAIPRGVDSGDDDMNSDQAAAGAEAQTDSLRSVGPVSIALEQKKDSPLHLAAFQKLKDEVEMLLASGEDINEDVKDLGMPLHAAILGGDLDIVRKILEYGADANALSFSRGFPLQVACRGGNLAMVQLLIAQGADANLNSGSNSRNVLETTALHIATSMGYRAIVECLLRAGADPNAEAGGNPRSNVRALHLACLGGHDTVVELLLAAGADADASAGEETVDTPVRYAASRGFHKIVRTLLLAGADPKKGNPLHIAAYAGHPDVVDLLLKSGVAVNSPSSRDGSSALHQAASAGISVITHILLDAGANVNYLDNERNVPLHLAAENGHRSICSILLDHGANLDARNAKEETPLYSAINTGHSSVVEHFLVIRKHRITAEDMPRFLEAAAANAPVEVMELLFRFHSCTDSTSEFERSRILLAACDNNVNVLRYLVEQGFDLNSRNKSGEPVLHAALSMNDWKSAIRLMDAGADVNISGPAGTALTCAMASGAEGSKITLLLDRGAKIDAEALKAASQWPEIEAGLKRHNFVSQRLGFSGGGKGKAPSAAIPGLNLSPNLLSISNIPASFDDDRMKEMLRVFGELRSFSRVKSGPGKATNRTASYTHTINCEYGDSNAAQLASSSLDGLEVDDSILRVTLARIPDNGDRLQLAQDTELRESVASMLGLKGVPPTISSPAKDRIQMSEDFEAIAWEFDSVVAVVTHSGLSPETSQQLRSLVDSMAAMRPDLGFEVVARSLMQRLQQPTIVVQHLTLDLTLFLVDHCGSPLVEQLASSKFVYALTMAALHPDATREVKNSIVDLLVEFMSSPIIAADSTKSASLQAALDTVLTAPADLSQVSSAPRPNDIPDPSSSKPPSPDIRSETWHCCRCHAAWLVSTTPRTPQCLSPDCNHQRCWQCDGPHKPSEMVIPTLGRLDLLKNTVSHLVDEQDKGNKTSLMLYSLNNVTVELQRLLAEPEFQRLEGSDGVLTRISETAYSALSDIAEFSDVTLSPSAPASNHPRLGSFNERLLAHVASLETLLALTRHMPAKIPKRLSDADGPSPPTASSSQGPASSRRTSSLHESSSGSKSGPDALVPPGPGTMSMGVEPAVDEAGMSIDATNSFELEFQRRRVELKPAGDDAAKMIIGGRRGSVTTQSPEPVSGLQTTDLGKAPEITSSRGPVSSSIALSEKSASGSQRTDFTKATEISSSQGPQTPPITSSKNYCPVCGERFRYEKDLRRHQKYSHRTDSSIESASGLQRRADFAEATENSKFEVFEKIWQHSSAPHLESLILEGSSSPAENPFANWTGHGDTATYANASDVPLEYQKTTKVTRGFDLRRVRWKNWNLTCKISRKRQGPEEYLWLKKFSHSHIVQSVGYYELPDKMPMLIYPAISWTLDQFLNSTEEGLSPRLGGAETASPVKQHIVRFFSCIASALNHIHASGFCHGNLHPGILLVRMCQPTETDPDTYYKIYLSGLLTFGLNPDEEAEKYMDRDSFTTRQIFSTKSDIFPLGAIYTEMMATISSEPRQRTRLFEALVPNSVGNVYYSSSLEVVRDWLDTFSSSLFDNLSLLKPSFRRNQLCNSTQLRDLVKSMLDPDGNSRPRVSEVLRGLGGENECCLLGPDKFEPQDLSDLDYSAGHDALSNEAESK